MTEKSLGRTLMTTELQDTLRKIASENTLSCEQIQQFAAENGLELESMRALVESAGIIVAGCRGACS